MGIKARFQYDCTAPKSSKELEFIIDNSKRIVYESFKKKVNNEDFKQIAEKLGYGKVYEIRNDPYVTFHSSKLRDETKVYYMEQSMIDYVFYNEKEK